MNALAKNLVAALLVLPGLATAGVVHIEHGSQLPAQGTQQYDLDADGTYDIGLAEDCCYDETLWINGDGYATSFQWAFVNVGDLIDSSLNWVSGVMGYTTDLAVGTSYIAVRNTSVGANYGYFSIDFDGLDTFLSDFWYEDTGASITVGATGTPTSVPEPSVLALFGIGLAGMGFARRRRAK